MKNQEKHGKENLEAIIDGDWVAVNVVDIIYNQGKAKIFNVLESQLSSDDPSQAPRLLACKRIVQDILANISKNAGEFIRDTLGDWEVPTEVESESDISEEDIRQCERDYQKARKILPHPTR